MRSFSLKYPNKKIFYNESNFEWIKKKIVDGY